MENDAKQASKVIEREVCHKRFINEFLSRVETALTNLDGKYNKPEFIDYFFTPIEKSTNATMEFAKLVRDIKINAPAKWTGIQKFYHR